MVIIASTSRILIRIFVPRVVEASILPYVRKEEAKVGDFLIQKQFHCHMVCPSGTTRDEMGDGIVALIDLLKQARSN